jgi:hypothetical protein
MNPRNTGTNTYSKVQIIQTTGDSGVTKLEEMPDILKADITQGTPILIDFGRLGSFLYEASGSTQASVLSKSGAHDVIL